MSARRRRLHRDLLLVGDALQDLGDLLGRGATEVEAMAAIDHGREDLLGLSRGQHENRPGRRLLQGLEERVPRLRGQHVRLVEDVDLVTSGHRRIGHLLAQVADVVDGVVRRRVHLDDVERGRAGDRDARVTHPARLDGRATLAVQAGGQDLGHARLACPARAHKQVGVVDLPALHGVAQGAYDVLLADDVGEAARAVAAVERGAGGHGFRV